MLPVLGGDVVLARAVMVPDVLADGHSDRRLLGHAEDGVVRAGCSCYTSADEVQRLISGVQALRQG